MQTNLLKYIKVFNEWRQMTMQKLMTLVLTTGLVILSTFLQTMEVSAKAKLPSTGESSSPVILIAAGLAIVAGLLLFFYKKKDNNQDK